MNKNASSHNCPTFRMVHYGYELNCAASQPALNRHECYLRCARNDEFKATWAPFLDLEYVESDELTEDSGMATNGPADKLTNR
jgi:hypothetical protein